MSGTPNLEFGTPAETTSAFGSARLIAREVTARSRAYSASVRRAAPVLREVRLVPHLPRANWQIRQVVVLAPERAVRAVSVHEPGTEPAKRGEFAGRIGAARSVGGGGRKSGLPKSSGSARMRLAARSASHSSYRVKSYSPRATSIRSQSKFWADQSDAGVGMLLEGRVTVCRIAREHVAARDAHEIASIPGEHDQPSADEHRRSERGRFEESPGLVGALRD